MLNSPQAVWNLEDLRLGVSNIWHTRGEKTCGMFLVARMETLEDVVVVVVWTGSNCRPPCGLEVPQPRENQHELNQMRSGIGYLWQAYPFRHLKHVYLNLAPF